MADEMEYTEDANADSVGSGPFLYAGPLRDDGDFAGNVDQPRPPTPEPVSPNFDADDADMTFRSANGILFKIRTGQFTCCPDNLFDAVRDPDAPKSNSIVTLEEDSPTLEVLLRFMIAHQSAPDLVGMTVGQVISVARAAEKYTVPHTQVICRYDIEIKTEPALSITDKLAILQYSYDFDYASIANKVAPMTITALCDLTVASRHLDSEALIAWVQYREGWNDLFRITLCTFEEAQFHANFANYITKMEANCPWLAFFKSVVWTFSYPHSLVNDLKIVFDSHYNGALRSGCSGCRNAAVALQERLEQTKRAIKPFSTFL